MILKDFITNFNTTPFLFLGSGISRRYLGLPDWKGLLIEFAQRIHSDEFAYEYYEQKAMSMNCKAGLLPKISELIQLDFDKKWFEDVSIRKISDDLKIHIKNGASPYKVEICKYIQDFGSIIPEYTGETELLQKLSYKNITGVITTNYDTLIETLFRDYKKYIGQEELIFSPIQGIAEIYKIHGTVETPSSIILNEKDYEIFESNNSYLAAKLLTIFMEYPVIFMGYSITDRNIQKILTSIIACLKPENLKKLENRFLFVEYSKDTNSLDVESHTILLGEKSINMKKVTLSDFSLIYNALQEKKNKLPAKVLRRFKDELYHYVVSNQTKGTMKVALFDDTRIADEDLILGIGSTSNFGVKGLKGLSSNEWYTNIILNDLNVPAEDLLEFSYPSLFKSNSKRLPVYKYISLSKKSFPEIEALAKSQNYESFRNNTSRKNSQKFSTSSSLLEIYNSDYTLEKKLRLILFFDENQMNLEELETILLDLFQKNRNILNSISSSEKSQLRTLILIYDYLKWKK